MKLDKAEQAQKLALYDALAEAAKKLEEAAGAYNEVKDIALGKLNDEVRAYNTVLDTVREFVESVTSDLSEEIDRKSEKWQESDKGKRPLRSRTSGKDLISKPPMSSTSKTSNLLILTVTTVCPICRSRVDTLDLCCGFICDTMNV